jgi:hypothetical protein
MAPRGRAIRGHPASRAPVGAPVVDTRLDGVHAGLARSAFEAVSATILFQKSQRQCIRLTDQFGFE